MIYISDKEQERIKLKIGKLWTIFKKPIMPVLIFQLLGALILVYGSCVGRYKHPISDRILNPTYDFLISCFFYFAISVASPFSGGHINPAVTIASHIMRKNPQLKIYLIAQIIGAFLGASTAYLFFGVVPNFYYQDTSFLDLLQDFAGEIFGAFFFMFFFLIVTETNYMAGEYFRYMLISVMYLAGRVFTLRKRCINPIIGIVFQFYSAIDRGNFLLFIPYSLPLIIGPIIGSILAVFFFRNIYAPLKQGLALQKMQSQISQEQS